MMKLVLAVVCVALVAADGGDFEFKCETTCQLVQKTGPGSGADTQALLQEDEGATAPVSAQKLEVPKECYSICLNPTTNPGCSQAAAHASFLQTGERTAAELFTAVNADSGTDCLDSCVRVCTAVKAAM